VPVIPLAEIYCGSPTAVPGTVALIVVEEVGLEPLVNQ